MLDLVGLVGEGSREARGDGAADDWAEVWDDCDGSLLESQDSVVLGVRTADDSREGVGCEERLASVEPLLVFCDLSMTASYGRRVRWEEWSLSRSGMPGIDRLSLQGNGRCVGRGEP